MKAVFARSLPIARVVALVAAPIAMLTGCASTGPDRTQVTRFHLGDPIARGHVAVEPFAGQASGPEFGLYATAVEQQLARLGWTIVRTRGQSEQVALVGLTQESYTRSERGPVSVGVGGGSGGWNSGVGAGIGFNLGGGPRRLSATTLRVRIARRSDGTVAWEGRAATAVRADRPEASPVVLAPRLAEAVFQGFPGESGRTISVK